MRHNDLPNIIQSPDHSILLEDNSVSSPELGMLVTVFPNIIKILNLNETWLSFFLAFYTDHGKTVSEDALGP